MLTKEEQDKLAKKILADMTGMPIEASLNDMTKKLIFSKNISKEKQIENAIKIHNKENFKMGTNDNTRNYSISLTRNDTETMDFIVSSAKFYTERMAELYGCIFLNEILNACFNYPRKYTQFIQRYGYLAGGPVSIDWHYEGSSVVVEFSNLVDLFDHIPIE